MSQHDFTIDDQGAPQFRADINSALRALASLSGGDTAPATTFSNQLWYEADANTLWMRNEANSAWLKIAAFDWANSRVTWFGSYFQPAENDGSIHLRKSDGTALLSIADDGDVSGAVMATQAQAEAGTDNESLMTPLRTQQAISEHGSGATLLRDFSQTSEGYREIAYTYSSTLGVGESFNLNSGVNVFDYTFLVFSVVGSAGDEDQARKTALISVSTMGGVTRGGSGVDAQRVDPVTFEHNKWALEHNGLPAGNQFFFLGYATGTNQNTLWMNAGGSAVHNYIKISKIYGL